jgi:hypothetical protein
MRKALFSGLVALAGIGFSMSADATTYAVATGTVVNLQQTSTSYGYSPETIAFTLSTQPAALCGGFGNFIIAPTSVPDAQTRKNYLAMLLTAKATGIQLQVQYDSSGGFCDQGMTAVYYIIML